MNAPRLAAALVLALAASAVEAGATPRPASTGPCGKYLYVPPDLASSVVFYHSFSRGAEKPEVNRLKARLSLPGGGRIVAALTGKGYGRAAGKGGGVNLSGLSWPLTRPITVSLWFRLEEPMKPETAFHLISLYANGYISNFVRGKGQWCALKRPTFVAQLYRFPGISNVNGLIGSGRLPHAKWHHAAVTVSEGSRVRVFWNARLRSEFTTKGRLFGPTDAIQTLSVGPTWLGHPMTIDEVLVLGRALAAADIQAYTTAVRRLAEMHFPFEQ